MLWAEKAREEHDTFTEALRSRGVAVDHLDQLLARVLEQDEAQAFVLDRLCTADQVGPALAGPLRHVAEQVDARPSQSCSSEA